MTWIYWSMFAGVVLALIAVSFTWRKDLKELSDDTDDILDLMEARMERLRELILEKNRKIKELEKKLVGGMGPDALVDVYNELFHNQIREGTNE